MPVSSFFSFTSAKDMFVQIKCSRFRYNRVPSAFLSYQASIDCSSIFPSVALGTTLTPLQRDLKRTIRTRLSVSTEHYSNNWRMLCHYLERYLQPNHLLLLFDFSEEFMVWLVLQEHTVLVSIIPPPLFVYLWVYMSPSVNLRCLFLFLLHVTEGS